MSDLRKWRDSLYFSQPEMARYVGVSLHTWRKWEQGQHDLTGAGAALVELLQELDGNPMTGDQIITIRKNHSSRS
jgi:DNA-binding transcriptional regulator YiaG